MIREYSVFITDTYLPWEHTGTALYLRKSPEGHACHIKYVSKALKFAFFNNYLANQKNKHVFVVFPVLLPLKCSRLLVGYYNAAMIFQLSG